MSLVQITYYRNNDKDNFKTAVVTETQARDIKALLAHIHVISVAPVPKGSKRSHCLD